MSEPQASPSFTGTPVETSIRQATREATGYWWLWLVAGIAWIVISVVILQFDSASITTVGVLVGVMFLFAGAQSLTLATMGVPAEDESTAMRWVYGIFAFLFLISAGICFISPENTFAALADILGFLFLIVGISWMVQAFAEKPVNPLWWLGLISGILMTILAFWTGGQFFIEKAYLLLVFAGVWALMQGIVDIVRAFTLRDVHEEV